MEQGHLESDSDKRVQGLKPDQNCHFKPKPTWHGAVTGGCHRSRVRCCQEEVQLLSLSWQLCSCWAGIAPPRPSQSVSAVSTCHRRAGSSGVAVPGVTVPTHPIPSPGACPGCLRTPGSSGQEGKLEGMKGKPSGEMAKGRESLGAGRAQSSSLPGAE